MEGGICAAVIHIDDLKGVAAALEGFDGFVLEQFNILRFVKAGNNQRELQLTPTHIFIMIQFGTDRPASGYKQIQKALPHPLGKLWDEPKRKTNLRLLLYFILPIRQGKHHSIHRSFAF